MADSAPHPASPDRGSGAGACAIGLDLGGTKMAGGLVGFPEAEILARRVVPTLTGRSAEAILADALHLAEALFAEARARELQVAGLGLSLCELVDVDGNVISANCLPWRGLPLREKFGRLTKTVIVEADSRAAAFAEARFGAGRPFKIFFYVTIGTGIGSSLVLDGRPYTGAGGRSGTLASSPLTAECASCGALLHPVLEEIASGPALVRRFNDRRPGGAVRGEDVLAAAAAGDPHAVRVVETAGEALGSTLGLLVNVLDPEALVIGGGLSAATGLYWDSLTASTRRHIWSETHRSLPILRAAFGADAGVVGAAAALLEKTSASG